jgi:hypothetical protein
MIWSYAIDLAEALNEGRHDDADFLRVGYDEVTAIQADRERYATVPPLGDLSLSERAQALKQRAPLLHAIETLGSTTFQQRGRAFWASCPFHSDTTPSLKADPDKRLWHCFSCRRGGDVFTFVQELLPVHSFAETIRIVAAAVGLDPDEFLAPYRGSTPVQPPLTSRPCSARTTPVRRNIRIVSNGKRSETVS